MGQIFVTAVIILFVINPRHKIVERIYRKIVGSSKNETKNVSQ